MKILCSSILLYLIILKSITLSAIIHPNKDLTVVFKEGFIIHLNTNQDFRNIKRCFFQHQGTDENEMEIKLNSKVPLKRDTGEIILPYSKTKCGIRVDNLSFAAAGNWTLRAENDKSQFVSDSLNVVVAAAPKSNFEEIIKKEPGSSTIKCSNPNRVSSIPPQYCKIYNDMNELHSGCDDYSIVVRNKTSYKCNTLVWSTFKQSKEKIIIEPIVKIYNGINSTYEETEDYITMTCQFPTSMAHCKAEYPDEITGLLIQDGLMSGRHSTLNTKTSDGKCTLEIKKPLKTEEIGIWKIFNIKSGRPSGCLFYVGEDKTKLIKQAINRIKPVETLEFLSSAYSSKLELKCKAPFPIELCYLVDPNNTIHFPDQFTFSETKDLGYCRFALKQLAGEYKCGLSGSDFYEDQVIHKYEVKITKDIGEAITPLVQTSIGESIELLCRIPFNTIDHCAFIDPRRNIHYLSNHIKTKSSRISYFGEGLEFGYCGIKVNNIEEDDLGIWNCHIRAANYKYSSFDIKVELAGISTASAIGLGIGSFAGFILFVASIIYFFRRKRVAAEETQNDDSSEQPIQMGHVRGRRSIDSGASQSSFTSKES